VSAASAEAQWRENVLEQRAQEQNAEIAGLKKMKADAQETQRKLEAAVAALERENEALRHRPDFAGDVQRLKEKLERLQQGTADRETEVRARLERETAEHRQLLSEMAQKHSGQISEMAEKQALVISEIEQKHTAELSELTQKHAKEIADQSNSASLAVQRSAERITELEGLLELACAARDSVGTENAGLRQKVTDLEAQTFGADAKIEEMKQNEEKAHATLSNQARQHLKEREAQRGELGEALRLVRKLRDEREELIGRNKSLEDQMDEMMSAFIMAEPRPGGLLSNGGISRAFKREFTIQNPRVSLPPLDDETHSCPNSARRARRFPMNS
jgi:hypothetical protein